MTNKNYTKIIAAIMTSIIAVAIAGCGNVNTADSSKAETKKTTVTSEYTSESTSDLNSAATTTTAKTTTSKATTTKLVTVTDKDGKVTTMYAIGEDGKTITFTQTEKADSTKKKTTTTTKKSTTSSTNKNNTTGTTRKTTNTNSGSTNNSGTAQTYTYYVNNDTPSNNGGGNSNSSGNSNSGSSNSGSNNGGSNNQQKTEAPKPQTEAPKPQTEAPKPDPKPQTSWVDNLSRLDRAYYNFAYGNFSNDDWNLIYNDCKERALRYNGTKGGVWLDTGGYYHDGEYVSFDGTMMIKIDPSLRIIRDSNNQRADYTGGFLPGAYKGYDELTCEEDVEWFKREIYANIDCTISVQIDQGWFDDDNTDYPAPLNFDWYIEGSDPSTGITFVTVYG